MDLIGVMLAVKKVSLKHVFLFGVDVREAKASADSTTVLMPPGSDTLTFISISVSDPLKP